MERKGVIDDGDTRVSTSPSRQLETKLCGNGNLMNRDVLIASPKGKSSCRMCEMKVMSVTLPSLVIDKAMASAVLLLLCVVVAPLHVFSNRGCMSSRLCSQDKATNGITDVYRNVEYGISSITHNKSFDGQTVTYPRIPRSLPPPSKTIVKPKRGSSIHHPPPRHRLPSHFPQSACATCSGSRRYSMHALRCAAPSKGNVTSRESRKQPSSLGGRDASLRRHYVPSGEKKKMSVAGRPVPVFMVQRRSPLFCFLIVRRIPYVHSADCLFVWEGDRVRLRWCLVENSRWVWMCGGRGVEMGLG